MRVCAAHASLIDATGRRTAFVALRNSLYMLPLGFAACALGVTTPPFAWEAAALSACMAAGAASFAASPSSGSARRLFLLSLVHLPVLQTACVVHRVPNVELAREEAKADTLSAWYRRTRERTHAEETGRQERMTAALLSGHVSSAPFPFLPRFACMVRNPLPRARGARSPVLACSNLPGHARHQHLHR